LFDGFFATPISTRWRSGWEKLRVSPVGLAVWRLQSQTEIHVLWSGAG
jgi:hypothetical protein